MSMTSLYYGEIKPERLETWNTNSDPYDILVERHEISPKLLFQLHYAERICSDEVKVDWGSFAYKCTKNQLQQLEETCKLKIEGLDDLEDGKVYGLVWIEEY